MEEKDIHEQEFKENQKCDLCGRSFLKATQMKKHIQSVHEDHKKDYRCVSCDKFFSSKYILKKHIHTIHEGHKDHKCESCGKSFTGDQHLKKHIPTVDRITNVNLVANLFQRQDIRGDTFI